MESDKIRVGLMGLGVVGSGTYKILETSFEEIRKQLGADVVVDKVLVRDMSKARLVSIPETLLTINADDILDNPDIDIIVELMGGVEPAYSYIRRALNNKKHVVTANKELLAKKGDELFAIAKDQGLIIGFEASVCGGIPLIKTIKDSLSTDKITKITGIVNGTTNYILSKMSDENLDYENALNEAKEKGFAESDPTADVEGFDAAYKIAILSSLSFNKPVNIIDVSRKGITDISKKDIEDAKGMGNIIKLIAMAEMVDDKLEIGVGPEALPKEHPLASVNGVNNGVLINSESVGELAFYGPGAGQLPTGNSVVSDIIDIAKKIMSRSID